MIIFRTTSSSSSLNGRLSFQLEQFNTLTAIKNLKLSRLSIISSCDGTHKQCENASSSRHRKDYFFFDRSRNLHIKCLRLNLFAKSLRNSSDFIVSKKTFSKFSTEKRINFCVSRATGQIIFLCLSLIIFMKI